MKKSIALVLSLILALSLLSACAPAEKPDAGKAENPTTVEDKKAAEDTTAAEEGKKDEGTADKDKKDDALNTQIHFAGSSSLAPVIASIGASFIEKYGTWDKVNADFPAEAIDIPVTSGGSGDGPSSVADGTADFGMLARSVKDSERESLGDGYTEYMVAYDALTISVNSKNPIAKVKDDLDTETIRKIFAGEIKYWDELDDSLEHKEIVVVIRDLSGGAAEVFEKNVMQGTPISDNAIQSPSMGALAKKIVENEYAIGYAGFGVYNQNKDDLFAFKVDGVEASEANILDGSYKIQRPVLFVTNRPLDPAEKAFVDYIFSDTGRQIVSENGYIPAF